MGFSSCVSSPSPTLGISGMVSLLRLPNKCTSYNWGNVSLQYHYISILCLYFPFFFLLLVTVKITTCKTYWCCCYLNRLAASSMMALLSYQDQNALSKCFLIKINFAFSLRNKEPIRKISLTTEATNSILVLVVEWRHHANAYLMYHCLEKS